MKKPERFDYIKTVGRISLHWNVLEIAYHDLFSYYMRLDRPTLAAVLNRMGNDQKSDLLAFLVETQEKEPEAIPHMIHFRKMFGIVSDNRNIVVHGLPSNLAAINGEVRSVGRYDGLIYRRNKLGKIVPYRASKADLLQTITAIEIAHRYIIAITRPFIFTKKFRAAAYTSLEKPPLPPRLIPNPLPAMPKGG